MQDEALGLLTLVGRNGDTVETVRKLIEVPPRIETALRAYAASPHQATPDERRGIERALRFRRKVALEFERLLADRCRGGVVYAEENPPKMHTLEVEDETSVASSVDSSAHATCVGR